MNIKEQQLFTGERSLFMGADLKIIDCTFENGESPLKESSNIELEDSMFKWKYPIWYSENIALDNCILFETARAGIWYTKNISLKNCTIDAPKTFRRANGIKLENITMPNADETLWNCTNIQMNNVSAKGDYFGMGSSEFEINNLNLSGNYPFDSGKNISIKNSRLISKDAFWNCENVTVSDSFISGQYIGWNSKNITFINCTIESEQGFCYMKNAVLKNCRLINTNLAFEYSTVTAEITTEIDSIKNPLSSNIQAKSIGKIIFDDKNIDKNNSVITFI